MACAFRLGGGKERWFGSPGRWSGWWRSYSGVGRGGGRAEGAARRRGRAAARQWRRQLWARACRASWVWEGRRVERGGVRSYCASKWWRGGAAGRGARGEGARPSSLVATAASRSGIEAGSGAQRDGRRAATVTGWERRSAGACGEGTYGRQWSQRGAQRAALPCSRVQGMKEEREGREKEGAGQRGLTAFSSKCSI